MRKATFGAGVGRGVWVAPWMGPSGELILVAVRRDDRMLESRMLAPGDDHVRAGEELWEVVERDDPVRVLRVI